MSGYYYSREAGAEGQILTGEGAAPGMGLDTLLDRERPPLRAALAIGSAIADVLCIAVEDRCIHGDIRPAHIKIDNRGTVSVEGYGVARRTTKAPEGKPDSHAVDVYGLGVVLHSILSAEPLGNLPKEPDGHDDEVVSRVLSMDFREVQGKRWLEDVRKFLCQILAWSPVDRPEALDAANVLASVASQCPGETLEGWAQRASSSAAAAAPAARGPVDEEEDLGGPVALSGPLAKGGVRKAPAAKGESTAFWSREKIAAMLAEDDDEPIPPPVKRQTVSPPASPARAPTPSPRSEPTRPTPVAEARPAEPAPRPVTPKADTARPVAEARPAASPFAGARIEPSYLDDDPPKKKSSLPMIVGAIGLLLVLICGVVTLGGGGWYWFMGSSGSSAAVQAAEAAEAAQKAALEAASKAQEDAEQAAADALEAGAGGADGATGDAGSASSKATTATSAGSGANAATTTPTAATTTPTPATTTTPKAAPETKAASGTSGGVSKSSAKAPVAPAGTTAPAGATAAPAAVGASFAVKFSAAGREGKLQCGDGQTAEFAGAATMTFATTTTCLVRIGTGRGAVQVSRSASVNCTEDAGKVSCTGA